MKRRLYQMAVGFLIGACGAMVVLAACGHNPCQKSVVLILGNAVIVAIIYAFLPERFVGEE